MFPRTSLAVAGVAGFAVVARLAYSYYASKYRALKIVPQYCEDEVLQELVADPDNDVVDDDGNLTRRVGVSLRLAKEVKLRFGGTPQLTEANRLLAARYIDEALVEHGVTRRLDRAQMMFKIRALVFTKLAEERLEDQWLNSQAAVNSHERGTGWGHAVYARICGISLPWLSTVRRRTIAVA